MFLAARAFEFDFHQKFDQFRKRHARAPAQFFVCAARVADERIDFGTGDTNLDQRAPSRDNSNRRIQKRAL